VIDRLFCLIGVNVHSWFNEIPRNLKSGWKKTKSTSSNYSTQTLEVFFKNRICSICQEKICEIEKIICESCSSKLNVSVFVLHSRERNINLERKALENICKSCIGHQIETEFDCVSLDCRVTFLKNRMKGYLDSLKDILKEINK
jgi:hypothetical protein